MLKNFLTSGALFITAASAVFLNADPALAAGHGGGGHGGGGGFHGGGFGGGFHGGGFHAGTFHGGFNPGFSNFHPNTFHSFNGFRNFNGFHDHRTFLRSGWGWGGPWWGWGGYSGYGYYPYNGGATYDLLPYSDTYVPSGTDSTSYYYDSYAGPDPATSVDRNAPTPIPAPKAAVATEAPARLTVNVPADAQVWIEGTKTTATGSVRYFRSPLLDPNSKYQYEVRATWTENGHEVTQTQQVPVTAGANARADFPVAANGQR